MVTWAIGNDPRCTKHRRISSQTTPFRGLALVPLLKTRAPFLETSFLSVKPCSWGVELRETFWLQNSLLISKLMRNKLSISQKVAFASLQLLASYTLHKKPSTDTFFSSRKSTVSITRAVLAKQKEREFYFIVKYLTCGCWSPSYIKSISDPLLLNPHLNIQLSVDVSV